MLGYLLLVLIPAAAIAYIVWEHKRKEAARAAASADRLQEMLGIVEKIRTEAPAPTASVEDASFRPAEAPPAPPPPPYACRERVLTPPQTLLYFLLRTALPDYIVFAQLPLSVVLEPSSALPTLAREEALKRLVARTFDFVVCDRNMRPVAAVDLDASRASATPTMPSPASWLASAGVRYVELGAAALPRKDAIREIVLGDRDGEKRDRSGIASTAT